MKYDHVDFGAEDIEALALELGLTKRQVQSAYSRAIRRTSVTLRARAQRGLKSEFGIRSIAFIRKRLRYLGFRKSDATGGTARLWFGLNDFPVSALQGTKRQTRTGAVFHGKAGTHEVEGGFVASSARWKVRTILKRLGKNRYPLTEAEVPIHDRGEAFVRERVFSQVMEIFWHHFTVDMKSRARGYGK